MLVTVGICTWNRAPLLRETLAALTRSTPPPRLEWEVLVVDNGCTDGTESVVAEFRERLPIRSVVEPAPGLSNARNRCIDESRGDYLLWTDDDVLVEADWLREYARAFQEFSAAAVFGGPVLPRFEGDRPEWLAAAWADVHTAYGARDLGDAVAPLSRRLPFGSNYAVRRAEQLAHRYDPRLGRNRHALLGGEETAVLRAILRGGAQGFWLPRAVVEHWIPRDRQTPDYLRRYYRGQGRVLALTGPAPRAESKPALFDRPLWLWQRALEEEAIYRYSRVFCGPERWVGDLARASTTWGLLAGWPARPRDPERC